MEDGSIVNFYVDAITLILFVINRWKMFCFFKVEDQKWSSPLFLNSLKFSRGKDYI